MKNRFGFSAVLIILAIAALVVVGGTIWFYQSRQNAPATTGNGAGTPNFSADPQSGSAPLTVQFRSTAPQSSNIDLGRSVDFGDGTSGTLGFAPVCSSCDALAIVSHTYQSQGTYTATLLNSSKSTLGKEQVTVNP